LKSFERFLSHLATIPDPRRAEGKLYHLPHVLLFSIFAIVSGANSYRGIRTFIKVHRRKLNKAFKISWKRPPAHTAIRYILQGLTVADVEKAFREHAANLNVDAAGLGARVCVTCCGGTGLRSADAMSPCSLVSGRKFTHRPVKIPRASSDLRFPQPLDLTGMRTAVTRSTTHLSN